MFRKAKDVDIPQEIWSKLLCRILRILESKWDFNRYGKYALQSRYYDESDEELKEDADGSDEDNVNKIMVGVVDLVLY